MRVVHAYLERRGAAPDGDAGSVSGARTCPTRVNQTLPGARRAREAGIRGPESDYTDGGNGGPTTVRDRASTVAPRRASSANPDLDRPVSAAWTRR